MYFLGPLGPLHRPVWLNVQFSVALLFGNLGRSCLSHFNEVDNTWKPQTGFHNFSCALQLLTHGGTNGERMKEWRNKWIEVFDDAEAIWLLNNEPKPEIIYANPKTHKDGWPLRHIISCCGTAIENVAK